MIQLNVKRMVQNIYNISLMTDPRRTTSISLIYARPIKSDYFLGQLMNGMIGMVDLSMQKECGRPDYVQERKGRSCRTALPWIPTATTSWELFKKYTYENVQQFTLSGVSWLPCGVPYKGKPLSICHYTHLPILVAVIHIENLSITEVISTLDHQ